MDPVENQVEGQVEGQVESNTLQTSVPAIRQKRPAGIPYEVFVVEHERAKTKEERDARFRELGYDTSPGSLTSRESQIRNSKSEQQYPLKYFKSNRGGRGSVNYSEVKARIQEQLATASQDESTSNQE